MAFLPVGLGRSSRRENLAGFPASAGPAPVARADDARALSAPSTAWPGLPADQGARAAAGDFQPAAHAFAVPGARQTAAERHEKSEQRAVADIEGHIAAMRQAPNAARYIDRTIRALRFLQGCTAQLQHSDRPHRASIRALCNDVLSAAGLMGAICATDAPREYRLRLGMFRALRALADALPAGALPGLVAQLRALADEVARGADWMRMLSHLRLAGSCAQRGHSTLCGLAEMLARADGAQRLPAARRLAEIGAALPARRQAGLAAALARALPPGQSLSGLPRAR